MNAERTVTIAAGSKRRAATIAMGVVFAVAGAARGDWLVLTSGDPIETKGAWTLEGQKVIFTTKRGVLASVRASEVNVDASRTLTAKKLEEATKVEEPPAPAPKRTPVLVLTDKDFEKTPPAAAADGAAAPSGEAAPASAAEAGAPGATVPAAAPGAQASAGSEAAKPGVGPRGGPGRCSETDHPTDRGAAERLARDQGGTPDARPADAPHHELERASHR